MDAIMPFIYFIGALAFMPLVVTIIGGINKARRERRRAAMFNRFNDRMGI